MANKIRVRAATPDDPIFSEGPQVFVPTRRPDLKSHGSRQPEPTSGTGDESSGDQTSESRSPIDDSYDSIAGE